MLCVVDRIALAAVPVIALYQRWLVWDCTPIFPTIFETGPCSYYSKNFIMLQSNNMNVGTENFLSLPFFIKVDIKCLNNFPTSFPLSGWIKM